MGGLESKDESIRVEVSLFLFLFVPPRRISPAQICFPFLLRLCTQTLKILQKLSPELPALQLQRIIALLESSASSTSLREKQSTISRALEIVQLLSSSEASAEGSDAATKTWETLEASHPKPSSKSDGHDASKSEVVLEEIAGRILGWVGESASNPVSEIIRKKGKLTLTCLPLRKPGSSEWKAAFVSKLLELSSALETGFSPSPTSTIILAAVACEYPLPTEKMRATEVSFVLARLLEQSSSRKPPILDFPSPGLFQRSI